MRKINKVLFSMLLIAMLVFVYPVTVRADEDPEYSGYEELVDSSSDANRATEESKTKTGTESGKSSNSSKSTNTTNNANTATKPHEQAGTFEVFTFATLSMVTIILAGIGYVQLKKYNY